MADFMGVMCNMFVSLCVCLCVCICMHVQRYSHPPQTLRCEVTENVGSLELIIEIIYFYLKVCKLWMGCKIVGGWVDDQVMVEIMSKLNTS